MTNPNFDFPLSCAIKVIVNPLMPDIPVRARRYPTR